MKCLSFLLLFPTLVWSSTEVWKMGDHFYEFTRTEESGLLISKQCTISKKCMASEFLKKTSFKNLSTTKFSGGKNPGAVLCHESKIGEVVFLKDLQGNDNSFCYFKDKSMVSSSSVALEARKNDGK
jgi:hypothetical protein